jgi:hypothetical protein
MKKLIFTFLLTLFCAVASFAQSTTVSGTVTDAGSQTWNNGTYQFTLIPNPLYPTSVYTWTGGALNRVITGSLSGSGTYSVSIPSNTAITPAGSKWVLQVTPNATSQSFSTAATTITGGTQTLNATPPAILISWSIPPGPAISAYSDSEIGGTLVPGSEYFNTTTLLTRVWNGSSWSNQGSGSVSGISGSGTTGFIPVFTGPTAIGNSHCDDGVTTASTVTCSQSLAVGANVTVPGTVITGELESTAATGGDLDVFCDPSIALCHMNIGSNNANEVVQVNGAGITETAITGINRNAPSIADTVGSAAAVTPGSVKQRVVTAGPDTILSTDRGNRVAYSSTSSVAVTLPQDGSGGFAGGFNMRVSNQNTGVVTITPTTSTINGTATLVLQEGQDCFITPDSTNTNWAADCNEPQMTAGAGISFTRAVHGLTINSTGGISGLTTNVIPKATSATTIGNSAITDNGTTVTSSENVVVGSAAAAHAVISTSGSYTCFQSNGTSVCVPSISGAIGTSALPGSGAEGFGWNADNLPHAGIGGIDMGTVPITLVSVSGTNTYVSTSPVGAYQVRQMYCFDPVISSTSTTPTMNVNSLGAITIVKNGGSALASGDLVAGHESCMEYNGTTFDLLNASIVASNSLALPATVSGTVNSGGIPYFSSTTQMSSSAALTANALVKGGGAGVAPSASSVSDNGTTVSTSELVTLSGTAAAAVSPFLLNGTIFTGGSGTSTVPYAYLNFGASPTTFSTNGTLLGINAPSGFTGSYVDIRANGGSGLLFQIGNTTINTSLAISSGAITSSGNITVGATTDLIFNGRSFLASPANGTIVAHSNAVGDNMFESSAFQSIGTKFTASGCSNSTTLGGASAGSFLSGTTGTCAVTITIGGSLAATNGWHCSFADHTTPANLLSQTGAASTTTASMTGTTVSGDLVSFSCEAY